MRPLLFLLSLLLVSSAHASTPVWSKTGHRVVGEVASKYLNAKARRVIADLLGGRSLAAVSNFADEIKSDRAYKEFGPWHYVNIPPGKAYREVTPSPNGDLIMGIERCVAVVADKSQPRKERVFYLKLLVHFIGDLHQPLHTGKEEDRGGNDIQVQWFGKGSNLHRVWDGDMIDGYGMSYTELAATLSRVSRRERKLLQQGNLYDWVDESRKVAETVYQSAKVGEKLGYAYSYTYWQIVENQLQKGGLRLAKVLNEVFS